MKIKKLLKKAASSSIFEQLPEIWQGRLDSNQRMAGSKPAALPLGDAPVSVATSTVYPFPLPDLVACDATSKRCFLSLQTL